MKRFLLLVAAIFTFSGLFAQQMIIPEKGWYVNDKGRFFVNKHLGVYLWLSFSPDENSPKHLLKSETCKWTNPMYFDTDGYNSIRTPWEVDSTGKYVLPQNDVVFEVYADGLPPKVSSKFYGAPRYVSGGKIYYGVGLKVKISATDAYPDKGLGNDEVSGVKTIYYSINGQAYQVYKSDIVFDKEGEYTLKYYAIDNVGNYSQPVEKKFIVDLTPPTIAQKIEGDALGGVYSPRAKIVLTSEDNLSGVKHIYYSIDGKAPVIYTRPIPITALGTGEHTFEYWSVDNVKNSNQGLANQGKDNNGGKKYTFEYDNVAPKVWYEIVGDHYKGKYDYISSRTKIKLLAEDKNGVKEIRYGINAKPTELYSAEFNMPAKTGLETFYYYAVDKLNNRTVTKSKVVYMDNTPPITAINYKVPQFFNRDTLFITSKTKIQLFAKDYQSGLQRIEYAIDGGEFKTYTGEFTIPTEGYHVISFRAVDRVNNVEKTKKSSCLVDNNAPKIYVNFSIEPIRTETVNGEKLNVYPTYTKMYLGATDKYAGTESIYFSINGGPRMLYVSAKDIARKGLIRKPGTYTVKIEAIDKLGNKSEKTVKFIIANE